MSRLYKDILVEDIKMSRLKNYRVISAVIVLIGLFGLMAAPAGMQDEEVEMSAVEWPSQYYAPYANMGGYPLFFFNQMAETTGVRFFTLAFVLDRAGDCIAAWSGSAPIERMYFMDDLAKLRALGGDVIVSFGGAAGVELAEACPDVESLAAQYRHVIDTLGVTQLDFDIEGEALGDTEANDLRAEAIALLQTEAAEAGYELNISFTLPVHTRGLTDEGVALLESALAHGVEIDVVNIMTMNFEPEAPVDRMGENTIRAAQSLFEQLKPLYPDKSDEEVWNLIGLTPMIGVNDRSSQIFTIQDAEQVSAFALENNLRRIAIWSIERDEACPWESAVALNNCSSVEQEPLGFSLTFNQITGVSSGS
jgi:chitinase